MSPLAFFFLLHGHLPIDLQKLCMYQYFVVVVVVV